MSPNDPSIRTPMPPDPKVPPVADERRDPAVVRLYGVLLRAAFPSGYPRELLAEAVGVFAEGLAALGEGPERRRAVEWIVRSFSIGLRDGALERAAAVRAAIRDLFTALLMDVAVALRRIRRQGWPAALTLGTIALASVPLFYAGGQIQSLLDGPPDLVNAERLFSVQALRTAEGDRPSPLSPEAFDELRATLDDVAELAAWRPEIVRLDSGDRSRAVPAARVTPNLQTLLGDLPAEPETPSGPYRPVIAGPTFTTLALEPGVRLSGDRLTIDGELHQVSGPPVTYSSVGDLRVPVWIPGDMRASPDAVPASGGARGDRRVRVVGRLLPDHNLGEVQELVAAWAETAALDHPETSAGWTARAESVLTTLFGSSRNSALTILGTALALITLTGLALLSLMTLRTEELRGLVRVERFLGASRIRRVRRVVIESLTPVVAAIGTGWALAFGAWLLMRRDGSRALPLPDPVGPVMLLVIGLPALLMTLALVVRAEKLGAGPPDPPRRSRRWALLTQIALATIMLVNGALIARSVWQLRPTELGLDPGSAVALRITIVSDPATGTPGEARRRILAEARDVPGVEVAGIASSVPLDPGAVLFDLPLWTPRSDSASRGEPTQYPVRWVTPDAPRAMGLRLISGDWPTPGTALVSRSLADSLWPGEAAVGRRVGGAWSAPSSEWVRVAGVVEDVRPPGVTAAPEIYLPLGEDHWQDAVLLVRGRGSWDLAWGVSAMLEGAEPAEGVGGPVPLQRLVGDAVLMPRLLRMLMLLIALPAVLVAGLGTWAFISGSLLRTGNEMRIRRAIGADRRHLLLGAARATVLPVALGLLIGSLGALLVARILAPSMLAFDPSHGPSIAAGLLIVALSVAGATLASTRWPTGLTLGD